MTKRINKNETKKKLINFRDHYYYYYFIGFFLSDYILWIFGNKKTFWELIIIIFLFYSFWKYQVGWNNIFFHTIIFLSCITFLLLYYKIHFTFRNNYKLLGFEQKKNYYGKTYFCFTTYTLFYIHVFTIFIVA